MLRNSNLLLSGGLAVVLLLLVGHFVVLLAGSLIDKELAIEVPPILLAGWQPTQKAISKMLHRAPQPAEAEILDLHHWLWTAMTAATVILAFQNFVSLLAGYGAGGVAGALIGQNTHVDYNALIASISTTMNLSFYPLTALTFAFAGYWVYSNARSHFILAFLSCAVLVLLLNGLAEYFLAPEVAKISMAPAWAAVTSGDPAQFIGALIGFFGVALLAPFLAMLLGALVGKLRHSRSTARILTAVHRLPVTERDKVQTAIQEIARNAPVVEPPEDVPAANAA
jgi:hypothetical protein